MTGRRTVRGYPLLLLLVAVAVVWWASHDFLARGFGRWPAITDAAALKANCAQLVESAGMVVAPVEIPRDDWPTNIENLHPRSVTVHPTVVDILISSGGIGSSYGYLVFAGREDPDTLKLYYRVRRYKDGIYMWQSQT